MTKLPLAHNANLFNPCGPTCCSPHPPDPSSAAAASSLEAALHSGEAVPWHTDNKDDDGEANHACTGSEPPVPALELLDIHNTMTMMTPPV